ncbi:MAG TPA: MFS transporter, partial [Nevskiaceae bacterium]|nr:MFS transporter [Nevskiaceae bacterium]
MPEPAVAPPPIARTPAERLRAIAGGSVGNLVEWYDWYAYSAFSLYFAKSFFPKGDLTAQLLNSAAIFAVGFLMRPLGGLIFGWVADRRGRKVALTRSVLLMCFGSLLIAVAPVHASIGVGAPILLLTARVIQGLSVGGEYGTSATYLSEMATREHRGFWSSFQYVTLILGQLAALGVLLVLQQVLTAEELEAWGWRIPFAIGAALALVALWLRRNLSETDAFVHAEHREPPLRALMRHPRELITVVGLTMGGTVSFY